MAKAEMIKTIQEKEKELWYELQNDKELWGNKEIWTRISRNRWMAVNDLCEALGIDILR